MEIEAKFIIPGLETLQQLAQVEELAGYELSPAETKKAFDTYLDTPSRAVRAAGYSCRRRVIGRDILITLKSLEASEGAIHRREEFEIALEGDLPPAEWPASSARDTALRLIGSEPLVPLFELNQTRSVRTVFDGPRCVAELSLDQVRVDAGGRSLDSFEVEVELLPDGTEIDLGKIAQSMQENWNLQPEPLSKFERALQLLDSAPPISLLTPETRPIFERIAAMDNPFSRRAQAILALDSGASPEEAAVRAGLSARRAKYWKAAYEEKGLSIFPDLLRHSEPAETQPPAIVKPTTPGIVADDPMSEAARKTLLFHFEIMLDHEEGTRAGLDVEELHDMRVATRRMRAALRLFDAYLDPRAIQPFVKALRRTARWLGAVRDLDVFKEKTQSYVESLAPDRKNDLDDLLAAWQTEYSARRGDLTAHLNGQDYIHFKEEFGVLASVPGAMGAPVARGRNEPMPYRVHQVLPVRLTEYYAQVVAYDEWVSAADAPLSRYHQLRIASKGLRYTLEFFRDILGPDAEPLIDKTKALQDHLGALQDAVVGCTILRNYLTWGMWEPGEQRADLHPEIVVAPGVATYLAARQEEIRVLVAAFPSVWKEIAGAEFKRRLMKLAAA